MNYYKQYQHQLITITSSINLISKMSSTWYIDFEGYRLDNKYIVKEISILNKDTLECYNYFVKSPRRIPLPPNTQTIQYQFKRHNLRWKFGDYSFLQAISHIILKVKRDTVWAKGTEKVKFLQTWLPHIEEMSWLTTSFKKLCNCASEVCEIRHGFNCARRKVHELRYIDLQTHESRKL
jgi:hypothetical protein